MKARIALILIAAIVTACATPVTVRRAAVDVTFRATDNYVVGAYHFTKDAVYPVTYVDSADGNYYVLGEGNFVDAGVKVTPEGTLADTHLYVDMGVYGGWSKHPGAEVKNGTVGLQMFEAVK